MKDVFIDQSMDFKKLYTDSKFPGSFSGKNRFIKAIRSKDRSIKRRDVEKALRSIDSYTLHKPLKKPKLYRRIYTKGINYQFQIDLIDMSKFEDENDGYRWFITIIDTFSKKAWAFKTKRKNGKAILEVMEPFLEENTPQKIEFDQGKEFYNRPFIKLLRRLKIKYFSVYSDNKCAIVERFNRTLKTRMYRSFTSQGNRRWVDILQDLVDGYNDSVHSSTSFKPNDVNKRNEHLVRRILYPKIIKEKKYTKPAFKVGDTVRLAGKKAAFQKGYEQTYSYEVFEISEIKDTYPKTYGIKDYNGETIEGSFYKSELEQVDKSDDIWPVNKILKSRKYRGETQYLVNFLGYPESLTEWISQNQLFNNAD